MEDMCLKIHLALQVILLHIACNDINKLAKVNENLFLLRSFITMQ